MTLLLDTQAFLWFIAGSSSLSARARSLIEDIDHRRLLSIASVWEMAIKVSLGKLNLAQPFDVLIPQQLAMNDIELLPIGFEHAARLISLPFYHRDPFDRLLVAQCMVERLPLVSVDQAFDAYGIERLW
jgi:PIN domain nuclease of toxin-antitoxin system